MKLTTITNVSIDGVMQGLGAPDEDRRGGFERGGWVAPLFDNEAGETVLSGDLAAAIADLKAKPGGELQVHGSGNLVRWLFDNQLVDEITLVICPVVVGQGTRLFPDTGPDIALGL
jgi:hypothetical protein